MCSVAVGAAFGQEAANADSAISAVDTIAVTYKDYYKQPCDSDSITAIHPSNYDYSELAKEIVNGCDDDYQRLKAIYGWICENIDYDTKFAIYSADKCIEAKRGTCQAYCELFYQIAKALNIRTEIIKGKAKDDNGYIDSGGHAWIFAYTRENHGILMDPT
jgi:transglutaminase/protease-like cytokinesis protein 3